MKKNYSVVGFVQIHNDWKRLYFPCYSVDDMITTFYLKGELFNRLFDKGKIKDFEISM